MDFIIKNDVNSLSLEQLLRIGTVIYTTKQIDKMSCKLERQLDKYLVSKLDRKIGK